MIQCHSCRNAGIKWKLANIKMEDSRSYCGQQVTSKADSNILQGIAADNEKESPAEVGKLCTSAVFKVGHKFHISREAAHAYNKTHIFLIRTWSVKYFEKQKPLYFSTSEERQEEACQKRQFLWPTSETFSGKLWTRNFDNGQWTIHWVLLL